ncbi:MAG TPA: hypothetical protein PKG56_07440 [Chitinophagaceae bacterium]|nr:hypothetical protein [Chitinophagaceae bacterium]MCC6634277.1 hypothetical protein [Chitinophagaceae bacterium]HMZ47042.1 hypothetical protein [Chitinophagaceae bacterium]HNE93545.1 hypothetical protein [Chitinophagaceae bacterium]HNL83210.1 hypothetical protein [Chitinophagaceae bacterium]
MLKIIVAILLCFNVNNLFAQEFIVTTPKQKRNDFAKNFVRVLNNAGNYFKDIKDKALKEEDTIFTEGNVFNNKIKLKGAVAARIIEDSTTYAGYFFGNYPNLDAVEAAYVNLTNLIAEALMGKVIFRSVDGSNKTPWVKQTKIAYTQNSGFFMFNMFVEIYQNNADSTLNLILKVKGGKPQYYYKIACNEPIKSFMFVSSLRTQVNTFQKRKFDGCLGDIPMFNCIGERKSKDSLEVVYEKLGFKELPDALKEFEATLTNIRVSLNDYYVYYITNNKNNNIKQVNFLKFDDIDIKHPKSLKLSLVEKLHKNFSLELSFVYK